MLDLIETTLDATKTVFVKVVGPAHDLAVAIFREYIFVFISSKSYKDFYHFIICKFRMGMHYGGIPITVSYVYAPTQDYAFKSLLDGSVECF